MTLGSMITKARKDAGLSIEDLSAVTNLRVPLIKEIESDYFANCGGEAYARGHIRNIATKLGVDPQIFAQAFESEQMTDTRSMKDLLVETNAMRQPGESNKISWKTLASISVSLLLVFGVIQIVVTNTDSVDEVRIATPVKPSSEPSEQSSATPNPTALPSDQPTISTGEGVEVIIAANRGKSWLFVSDATGRTLFSGQLPQGSTKTFTTDIGLNLKIGNAGGVDLRVNGKEIDSVGVDGQVVSVSYGVDS